MPPPLLLRLRRGSGALSSRPRLPFFLVFVCETKTAKLGRKHWDNYRCMLHIYIYMYIYVHIIIYV